jgi:uncharacterized protein DUF5670
MLWTIAVILIVLWLGMVSAYSMGGFIHILVILAALAVAIQLINGRRDLKHH